MCYFFFFNDTATTEIYTFPYTTLFRSEIKCLSYAAVSERKPPATERSFLLFQTRSEDPGNTMVSVKCNKFLTSSIGLKSDRKSTRLNSSHANISYAVFCLKKKTHIIYL